MQSPITSPTPSLTPASSFCPEQTGSSTKTALVQAAKAFGRVAYKMPYVILLTTFEAPSLLTEAFTGCFGGAVGILVGSTAILSRKCMGAKARRFFGVENPKTLRDYADTGFHTGARLGELPGKILGGCALVALGASTALSSGIIIPVALGISGTAALFGSISTFVMTKYFDGDPSSYCYKDFIHNHRIRNLKAHNRLKGIELLPSSNSPASAELCELGTGLQHLAVDHRPMLEQLRTYGTKISDLSENPGQLSEDH